MIIALVLIISCSDIHYTMATPIIFGTLIIAQPPVKTPAMAVLPAQTWITFDVKKITRVSASIQTFTVITILTVTMLRMKSLKTVKINMLRNSFVYTCIVYVYTCTTKAALKVQQLVSIKSEQLIRTFEVLVHFQRRVS